MNQYWIYRPPFICHLPLCSVFQLFEKLFVVVSRWTVLSSLAAWVSFGKFNTTPRLGNRSWLWCANLIWKIIGSSKMFCWWTWRNNLLDSYSFQMRAFRCDDLQIVFYRRSNRHLSQIQCVNIYWLNSFDNFLLFTRHICNCLLVILGFSICHFCCLSLF